MIRALVLAVSLVSGGGAAYLMSGMTGRDAAPAPTPEAPAAPAIARVQILTAAEPLRRGARITPDMLAWRTWPEDALTPDSILREGDQPLDAFAGLHATRRYSEAQPIAEGTLAEGAAGVLSAVLAPGARAVAIRTNAQNSAGGFILPEDRVDVVHTVEVETETGEDVIRARTILQGVRVLAIDQTSAETDSDTVIGETATLELTPQQAEIVTAAQASGGLSLTLRPIGDPAPADRTVRRDADDTDTGRTVRLIRGGDLDRVIVN